MPPVATVVIKSTTVCDADPLSPIIGGEGRAMGFQDEPAPADEAAPNPPTLADARDKFLRG